ncbi:MAG TPA: hypothetical protein PKL08_16655, partial [Thermoanaerobaculaceae bacterium]|nr:hypothetical protein [Thermoanaerobaculaceae bacterium]
MRRSTWTVSGRLLGCLLAAPAPCSAPALAEPNPCASLQRVGPVPSGRDLTGVASGGGLILALGPLGTLLTSQDGMSWTSRASGTTAALSGAAWGGGRFVVVGERGTILESNDGVTFATQSSGVTADLAAVTFGAGRFVAVGAAGTVLASPDGMTWAAQQVAGVRNLSGLAWNGSVFVAGGESASDLAIILTSPDGVTWQSKWTNSVTGSAIRSLAWAGGRFVAAGVQWQTVLIASSRDGSDWTAPSVSIERGLSSVAGSGSVWLATANDGVVLRSIDAVTWGELRSPAGWAASQLNFVTWTGHQFVAVGWLGGIATTVDGLTWQAASANLWEVASNGASYVATGSDILWSADGLTWQRSAWPHRGTDKVSSVTAYSGGYLAVGTSEGTQAALRSADGLTWDRTASFDAFVTGVVWAVDRFVAVGSLGFVATSTDGI